MYTNCKFFLNKQTDQIEINLSTKKNYCFSNYFSNLPKFLSGHFGS